MSRRTMAGRIACTLVLCVVSTSIGVPAHAGRATQTVRGHVALSAGPRTAGPVFLDACGLVGSMTGWAARRDVAVRFRVDARTRGRPFVLTPDLPADVDIVFFDGYRHAWSSRDRAVGAKRGKVPYGADRASVCLVAGPPTHFTYRTR